MSSGEITSHAHGRIVHIPILATRVWDRLLPRSESYAEKWQYVSNNPVRHSYVGRAANWPYQGELNVLEWHDP